MHTTDLEMAFTQLELLGFCLCSPFELLKEPPKNDHGSRDLERYLGNHIDIYGYLVTVKNTSTHNGKRMHFAYRFYGKVVSEFGFLSIEVMKMLKQDYIQDPRYADMKAANKVFKEKEAKKTNADKD